MMNIFAAMALIAAGQERGFIGNIPGPSGDYDWSTGRKIKAKKPQINKPPKKKSISGGISKNRKKK